MDRFEELMEQIRINLNDDKRFEKQLMWIRDKVEHYSSVFGFSKVEILEAFEKKRTYWSANYYQESNFPVLDDKVKIFETTEDLMKAVKSRQFICPACNQVQSNPYTCNSGFVDNNNKVCNWASYGLLGTLGKGFRFTVKESFLEQPKIDDCFMPVEFKDTIHNPEYKEKL